MSLSRKLFLISLAVLLLRSASEIGFAQDRDSRPVVTISRIAQAPVLSEFIAAMESESEIKTELTRVEGLINRFPKDGVPISERTQVYLGYDDRNIYAVFLCYDRTPDKVRAHMVARDLTPLDDDAVSLHLDTFHDRKRAYGFKVNPLGVQQDGVWTEGQTWDLSFDTVWISEARLTKNGYAALIAVPFKSLRFSSAEKQDWGFFVFRAIPRGNEQAYYPPYSSRVEGRLNQAADMRGLEGISAGRNWQVIPYGTFRSARTLDTSAAPQFRNDRAEFRGGVDAKLVIRDSLVLDLTANPDFSQVESDEPQIVTNQRFEVFFPERRPFFIENASYFTTPINLLFTRRVADPRLGARLTGKLGRYNIGALIIDDRSTGKILFGDERFADKSALFSVARVSRDLGENSGIGLIYTRRQFVESSNQVGGIDGRFKLHANWVAAFQAVASTTRNLDGSSAAGPAYKAALDGNGQSWNYNLQFDDRSPGFRTDSGFIQRADIREAAQNFSYRFRPEGGRLLSWGPDVRTDHVWDHRGLRLDAVYTAQMNVELTGQTEAAIYYTGKRERLRPADFPEFRTDADFAGSLKGIFVGTAMIPQLVFRGEYVSGTAINFVPVEGRPPDLASVTSINALVNARLTRSLTVDNTYLLTRLRERERERAIFNNHIIRSKWNYQLTRQLSFRAIMQYSAVLAGATSLETTKNLNADFLITWQLHPGTALFVGYNSNYENLDPRLALTPRGLLRTRDHFLNSGRQLFVKFSYLFRF